MNRDHWTTLAVVAAVATIVSIPIKITCTFATIWLIVFYYFEMKDDSGLAELFDSLWIATIFSLLATGAICL